MAGLVLEIDAVNPKQVQLNQIWLNAPGSEQIFDKTTYTWAPAWQPDSIPGGVINLSLILMDGQLNGQWQIEWEHQNPE
jgi:hypothetical protein